MQPSTQAPGALDIILALRQAFDAFWRDFAPIILLGFLFVTVPALFVHVAFDNAPLVQGTRQVDPTLGTLVQTFSFLLAFIFICAVNFGVMHALAGRQLETTTFMREGLRAARPGVLVALLLGALAMVVAIIITLFARGSLFGFLLSMAVLAGAVWAFAAWMVAIPAAIAERRTPIDALRRSAELTRGNRGRLVGLLLVTMLAILPPWMIVELVVFGPQTSSNRITQILSEMTLFSPGLWIGQLFTLLVLGLLATVPAVVYMQLMYRTRRKQD